MTTAIRHALLAVLLSSLTAVAAAAGVSDEPLKRTVTFADLDLTHASGVAVLYRRIEFAAKEVCEPMMANDLHSVMISRRCVEEAIARAVGDVNAPSLTSYYLAKTKAPITVAWR
jgi:UrcA family protein